MTSVTANSEKISDVQKGQMVLKKEKKRPWVKYVR